MLKENTPQGPDIIAHFSAHCEAVVALNFDQSGLMLVTADKNGHRFNVFKIHPSILGSSFAAVHHLYTLHRLKNFHFYTFIFNLRDDLCNIYFLY